MTLERAARLAAAWRIPPGRKGPSDAAPEVRLGIVVLVAFFGSLLGWAAFAPLDAAVVAQGVVVVAGNRQTVQHREGGVVSRLLVREGQRVERGAILVELGAPELIAEERALLAQILDLEARAARLAVETGEARGVVRPGEWSALPPDERALAETAFARHAGRNGSGPPSEAAARISGYRAQIASIVAQESLVSEELAAMRPLQLRGLIPVTRVNALERSLADLQGRRADLTAQISATQARSVDDLARVRAELAELLPRLGGVRARLERTRLRAPSTGAVVGLSVHTVGGVIAPGERVLDIVPDGQDLLVEANVRPQDVDALSVGQGAEVRFTAFGGRDMPIMPGEIQHISADRFVNERTGEGYFTVQIVVPQQELRNLDENDRTRGIRAGLPVDVVVSTRERTALQYIVEPLGQTLWRSLREQ